ncbi:MAG: VWA domain-containing protein [Desulfobulbaceae bacterium]|nr:VWA domain-containing protein [Desulfobulbaceae bacterium]
MNSIHFYRLDMLFCLVLPLLLAGFFVYAARKRRAALRQFMSEEMLRRTSLPVSAGRRAWKVVLLLLALTCLAVALARPAWNRKEVVVKRSGRDVVFLLDVSKSMLAEDLVPNRLEHAKLAIMDAVDRLQGDRVGLVVFAGSAVVKCPLTLDYGFFRMALEGVGTDAVSRGGTLLGDALRMVLRDVFDNQEKEYKDVILITDGEDHESAPLPAAESAAERGVRLIIIGLGDEKEGQRIPVLDEQGRKTFLKYKGQEVWTKLDANTLRAMAKATPGGRYLPVATGVINLGQVYQDLIRSADKKELEAKSTEQYEEKFQIFLAVAFCLLVLEGVLGERKVMEGGSWANGV